MADTIFNDGVASSAGAASDDYLTNLTTSRLQISQLIVEITANPKPTYTIDGQNIKWGEYLDLLRKQLRGINEDIAIGEADDGPFEIVSRGF